MPMECITYQRTTIQGLVEYDLIKNGMLGKAEIIIDLANMVQ